MSQGQGGSDTRQHTNSNTNNTGERNYVDARILGQATANAAGNARIAAEGSAMSADANGVTNRNENARAGTVVNINGGGGVLSETLDQQREPSPGPHLDEMATIEEGGYIRVNGTSHDAGGRGDGDVGSIFSSSQDWNDGDQDVSSDGFDPDLRRVKVYELVGSRWTDRGTAFCSGEFDESAEEAKLIARSEATSEVLLNTTIRPTDVYQQQQDTLIVWTESDGTNFALSFQDVEGCAEVWDFIIEVQRHLSANRGMRWSSDDYDVSTSDQSDELYSSSPIAPVSAPDSVAAIINSGHLPRPKPDPAYLGEIEKVIRTMQRTAKSREQICTYIQENRYIYQLVEVFEVAEREENIDALHALCSCMQTILLLNEPQMYEHILVDDLWLGVVGTLEYDPEFPKYKANYREFLLQRSRFIQPININDQTIQRKIHYAYRLQYLKDVILGRALDDSTFTVLNSCIIFNQIDIINHIQQDERFLTELVALFLVPEEGKGKGKDKDAHQSMEVDKQSINGADSQHVAGPSSSVPSSSQQTAEGSDIVERKKEVVLLLQQLCAVGKNVQLPARINLFRTLVDRGVLYAVQWALCRPEKHLVSTAGEILSVLLDPLTPNVRNHILAQVVALSQPCGQQEGLGPTQEPQQKSTTPEGRPPPFKETLSQVLVRMLANCHDFALQSQLADALRMLLDVPQTDSEPQPPVVGQKLMARPGKDDHSTERFLDNFYKVCADVLFRPLTQDVPEHHELKNAPFTPSRERGNLYLYLCDLLCSFAVQHSFRSFFFILGSNVLPRVASLLNVRDKHLSLAALRFFRICLRMNNRNLFSHLDKHECFTPITRLAIREARRDNLLSSTCQEFFEFMRKENLRDPMNYIMEKHEADLRELAKTALGASTFAGFVARWEINKEPPPPVEVKKEQAPSFGRYFGRVSESEEDDSYFLGDDDESQIVPVPVAEPNARLGLFPRRKRQRGTAIIGQPNNRGAMRPTNVPSQQRPQSPLSSLLDYEDEEDVTSPRTEHPNPLLAGRLRGQDLSTPHSPVLQHRQIEIPPYEPSSDPEDDLLESLVSNSAKRTNVSASKSPAVSTKRLSAEGPKPRVKRRHSDDDDDDMDMLERLTPKVRRVANPSNDRLPEGKEKVLAIKSSDEGPKKLKLKFTPISSKPTVQSTPLSSTPDTKEGDNG